LVDFDKTIEINKSGKCYFHKMFRLEQENIKDFILKLDKNDIFMITPYLSVNCKINDPYINLSRQFLVTNNSNYNLIYEFMLTQFETFLNDFNIDVINDNYYFLIFKHKRVELDYRI
jgi:hypothetical protein